MPNRTWEEWANGLVAGLLVATTVGIEMFLWPSPRGLILGCIATSLLMAHLWHPMIEEPTDESVHA